MKLEDHLFSLEEKFWTEGPDYYRGNLAYAAIMVFPEPTGVLLKDQIAASLEGKARWARIGRLLSLAHPDPMLVYATLAAVGLFGAAAARLPHRLVARYLAAFESRHGIGVKIGLTVLATLAGALLLATVLRPGHPRAELVNAAVVAFLGLTAASDLYLFTRKR